MALFTPCVTLRIASWSARSLALVTPLVAVGCGANPEGPATRPPLAVNAVPRGHRFEGTTTVELMASRPAQIFYTLGGEDPIGPSARLYEDALELDRTTLVTFVAASDDGLWSLPVSELYAPVPAEAAPEPVVLRGLRLDHDHHFFAAQAASEACMRFVFTLRSVGVEAVHVAALGIGVNPKGSGFFEEDVFRLETETPETLTLEPGHSLELTVGYTPTSTLRSAALYIVSDDQRYAEGVLTAELWGRMLTW